ncbi:lysophospholipid transporter LplT [Acidovorax sp. SUPP950]|uniref:lysophospholipid transporter LplT n=1 Tax=unclassified Acidovorax TaxID=2684926 RepID=UPI00234B2DAF|nr:MULTISPECIES: lysophospholipid transporter LplT [Comamonadaceae]WCM97541.1 lysophospholipid transporter LplT [Acidovorax sp. GBBC 1281]WOI46543.1 lysophospholipid transporter LplT [Paracidovorax avenae]GKS76026.1 lysophospholipid transporter LplT [Acidovorax sp. SUPP950]GKS87121.1 lysophospholipid transporter LplT [Acidovorax sp. SUPP1855]GKS89861.1 lysophospholipid transporter LplT [Acidovorax sp. SUPP2539]
MKRGFYTIMSAQFFSSLADNALFVAAVELLRTNGSPEWQRAALVPMFALFYVVLAPFVGAFADAMPKGKVMFFSNAIKVVGCLMMLFGSHPLIAYAVVGLGAAAYSPAKYGILTELLPASQLVKANGWIEGLTIASIILGVLLGGQLVGPAIAGLLLSVDLPFVDTGVDTAAEAAIAALITLYLVAAWFNTRIPHTGVEMRPLPSNPLAMLPDFWACNNRLWRDKLGQISLSTTTLFWGAGGNLKFIVLAWAAAALSYNTTQASALTGVVAIGTAVGAVVASMRMRLDMATKVIPLGIAMGLLLVLMVFIKSIWVAIPFLILLGGLGGYLVVPMNALLQHRGHNLMGAGRSIAVQNFNEQACILALGAFYSLSLKMGLSVFGAITAFGLVVAGVMWLIRRWHQHNCVRYREEVDHLLHLARHDHHH